MKIRHSLIHYLPAIFGMIIVWLVVGSQQQTSSDITLALIVSIVLAIGIVIVHLTDCLILSDGIVEGKRFSISPKFEISTLSAPRTRIRSCELKRFLFWNTITIKGPYGVTIVMHNMRNARRFTDEVKGRW